MYEKWERYSQFVNPRPLPVAIELVHIHTHTKTHTNTYIHTVHAQHLLHLSIYICVYYNARPLVLSPALTHSDTTLLHIQTAALSKL